MSVYYHQLPGLFDVVDYYIHYPMNMVPTYAQTMLHTLIAVNRFTAFFYPLNHASMWNKRVVRGTLAGVTLLSILLHAIPFYAFPWIVPFPPFPGDELGQSRSMHNGYPLHVRVKARLDVRYYYYGG